jgi:hypothetical protein
MTEHHGLDLDAIQAASGGHSIFAPSGSAMWAFCAGSLIPNLYAEDTAGEDAAYGTVGHEVGEIWLKRLFERYNAITSFAIDESEPRELVGTIRTVKERARDYDIEIDDDMLTYVRQYVEWCVALDGDHYVEERVDFSHLTPIPKQKGTADHAVCSWQRLVVDDLKMGRSPDNKVFAKENTQALLYAIGFFRLWDWLYDFQTIVIRIAQPRLEHFDEWTISREELLAWEPWFKERAFAAWQPNAPRSPAPKTCRWCKVKADCAALAAWTHQALEGTFDDLDVIEGEFRVISDSEMTSVSTEIIDGWRPDPKNPATLPTEALERLLPYRKLIEKWFSEIEAELEARAADGEELKFHKLVTGRAAKRAWIDEFDAEVFLLDKGMNAKQLHVKEFISPAKAEELLRKTGLTKKAAAQLLDSVVTRPPSRQTLVPIKDEREAIESPASVFDDLDDEL